MKENFKKTDREKVFEILLRILYDDGYSNILLKKTQFDVRPFATELVYGVIERKITLDEIIMRLSKTKFKNIEKKALILLYMGLYQLMFSNVKDYAAIYEVVELSKKFFNKEVTGFINGILRTAQRQGDKIKEEVYKLGWEVEYSIGSELLSMIKESKLNTKEILESTFIPPRVHIYVRKNMDNIKRALRNYEIGFYENDDYLYIDNYNHKVLATFFRRGEYSIMDYSTSIIKDFIPKEVRTVFDMCAAPGGKTLILADSLPNAKIKASDINSTRVGLLEDNIKRWGLENVSTSVNDARIFDGHTYDLVLCDVLCSGSGVISRKPELKYKIDYNMIAELNIKQSQILDNAIKQTNPGGYIIYSTCSILKRENENIISNATNTNSLEVLEDKLVIPSKNSEGFYACLLRKK